MLNCRLVSPETWAHARESLVFYFSRRHARTDAEDLAQETLIALWNREDYVFEKEEDFLKICYGFAHNISKQGYRDAIKHGGVPLDPDMPGAQHQWSGQRAMESRVLLSQVIEIGKDQLRKKDWEIIQQAAETEQASMADHNKTSNSTNVRVHLHRARKKLAKLAGL